MGILSGAMSARRFSIEGEFPPDFRERWRAALNEYAFVDSPVEQGKEEREGWVQIHNLLDTSFDDFNRWLYNEVALFALRVDKKTLPAKLFRATVQKEVKEWCQENGVERCPKTQKDEIRDRIESQWLKRCLPRVTITEMCLHMTDRYVLIHSQSEGTLERIRKRFFATFGLKLIPWSPMEWLDSVELVEQLAAEPPSRVGRVEHE